MGNGLVNDAPALRSIGVIAPGKEENLTCTLITRLAREQCRSITGIKRTNIRISLHECGMLARSNREIAHNIQAVSATSRPTGNRRNNDLRHGADQALDLQNMKASRACGVNLLASLFHSRRGLAALNFVVVAIFSADPLVATRTEGIATVARGGSVSRQNNRSDIAGHSRVVQAAIELIDGMWAECIANFWTIESNTDHGQVGALFTSVDGASGNSAVVGHIGQLETLNLTPARRVKGIGNEIQCAHSPNNSGR